jgi:hypothetical protein
MHYAKKILDMAGMVNCKATNTPMEERPRMSHNNKAEEVDATQYMCIVGNLRYLVHTR